MDQTLREKEHVSGLECSRAQNASEHEDGNIQTYFTCGLVLVRDLVCLHIKNINWGRFATWWGEYLDIQSQRMENIT
jgi:hypothetical protein